MCSSISRFHGQTPKVSALGQGMCQNRAIVALGIFSADELRQQREMKVLDQHHGAVGARLRRDHVGELGVDLLIGAPIARAKRRPHVRQVAQRPESLVGEAVVVPLFLLLGEPHAAQGVGRIIRRHADVVEAVHRLAIRVAGAVRDPHAGAGAHDGLERRDHAARGHLHHRAVVGIEVMDVGLAIRHDDHLRGMQVIAHHLAQRLRRPVLAKVDFQALLLLDLRQHLPHLGENRQRGARRLGVVEKALAADVADQHVRPAAQLQPGDEHDQQREQQHRDADEHQDEVARGALPAIDEAQVVQHDHPIRHRLAASKSKRDTCTDPDGSCTICVAAGPDLAVRLA